MNISKKKLDI